MTDHPCLNGGGPDLAAAVEALCGDGTVRVERDEAAVAAMMAAVQQAAFKSREPVVADDPDVARALRLAVAAAAPTAYRPSLLASLREAVEHGGESDRALGAAGARLPLRADALDLLDRIRGTIRDALDWFGMPAWWSPERGVDPIHADLRRLVVAPWSARGFEGLDQRDRFARRVHGYAAQAAELLTPTPEEAPPIWGAWCPNCAAEYVYEVRDGETIRSPALAVDYAGGHERGIQCRACGAYTWREVDVNGNPTGKAAELLEHIAACRAERAARRSAINQAERESAEARYPWRSE